MQYATVSQPGEEGGIDILPSVVGAKSLDKKASLTFKHGNNLLDAARCLVLRLQCCNKRVARERIAHNNPEPLPINAFDQRPTEV
eukprot:19751-Chlamydomonas_euryale.AAC.1